jgi:hypothetical protein
MDRGYAKKNKSRKKKTNQKLDTKKEDDSVQKGRIRFSLSM